MRAQSLLRGPTELTVRAFGFFWIIHLPKVGWLSILHRYIIRGECRYPGGYLPPGFPLLANGTVRELPGI